VFDPLEEPEVEQIVRLLSKSLLERVAEQGVKIKITQAAVKTIAEEGYDREYGARPVRRLIQTAIEDKLSEALLSGEISTADMVTIGATKGQITLKIKKASEQAVVSNA
nr:ATP-dependent Clp protease ATP-binding subunit ClpC [Serratia marcescens]